MPHEIQLDCIPAGYATRGGRSGEKIELTFRGFCSFEDGPLFVSRLEGFPEDILQKLPPPVHASASVTNSLFAVLRSDKTATVYYNDFNPPILMRAKKSFEKGEGVKLDDFMDIDRADLSGFNIPTDAGICYVFSSGWRKGYFFDFGPIQMGDRYRRRDYDLDVVLGQCHARLMFHHLFSIGEETWEEMLTQGWFPFVHLPLVRVRAMIQCAEEKLSIDDELDLIQSDVVSAVEADLETWSLNAVIAPHVQFFTTALERLKAGDYISAGSILYPKVEGLMRGYHVVMVPDAPTQANLATVASGQFSTAFHEASLMLPARFGRYLTEVYFRHFEPRQPVTHLSRNTVAHGVAPAELFNQKAAVLGFLVLLQITSVISSTTSKASLAQ